TAGAREIIPARGVQQLRKQFLIIDRRRGGVLRRRCGLRGGLRNFRPEPGRGPTLERALRKLVCMPAQNREDVVLQIGAVRDHRLDRSEIGDAGAARLVGYYSAVAGLKQRAKKINVSG